MKFAIRFANQIIGALIILALGILVFVIFMLGSSQRWFSRDYQYKCYFNSASGLSPNMPVLYKGFTIGHVKSVGLAEDDRVEVNFTIFDTYNDRVKEGSLVEILVSPIGGLGGNQFMFYSGMGTELIAEGETIAVVGTDEAKRLTTLGLAAPPVRDDNLNNIMNQVNTLLATLNTTLSNVQEAFDGTNTTSLGRTMGQIETLTRDLPLSIEKTLGDLSEQIKPVLADLNELSASLVNPQGTIMAVLDGNGQVYQSLLTSLGAVSGTLRNLENISAFIPSQLPQIAVLLSDLHTTLENAEDVLISLTNNPLLKGGIPERTETRAGGTSPRDMQF
ncbi:MAG TPA: MCE family protein [Treponema sp.]|nr:MCE family protein [Treponema sp.]